MKSKIVFLAFVSIVLNGCLNQVSQEERLVQVYPFSVADIMDYQKVQGEWDVNFGESDVSGEIHFDKSTIEVTFFFEDKPETDLFQIRTVTYDDNPNEIKYRTNGGEFAVSLSGDTIVKVSYNDYGIQATYYRAIEPQFISTDLPLAAPTRKSGWRRISIPNVGTIDCPPNMEVQSGSFRQKKLEAIRKNSDLETYNHEKSKLILQPKGINNLDQEALSKYSRVIYETIIGEDGDYYPINQLIRFNEMEQKILDRDLKQQVISEMANSPLKLIEWYPIEPYILNGMPCIKASFKRQFQNEPHVHVDFYMIQDYDKIHRLTVSYRINEKEIWGQTLPNVINTFRITKFNTYGNN